MTAATEAPPAEAPRPSRMAAWRAHSFGPASEQPYRRRTSDWIRLVLGVGDPGLRHLAPGRPGGVRAEPVHHAERPAEPAGVVLPAALRPRRALGPRAGRRGCAGGPPLAARPRHGHRWRARVGARSGDRRDRGRERESEADAGRRHPGRERLGGVPGRAPRGDRRRDLGRVSLPDPPGAAPGAAARAAHRDRGAVPRDHAARRRARRGRARLGARCARAPRLRVAGRPTHDRAGGGDARRARGEGRRGAPPADATEHGDRDVGPRRDRRAHGAGPRSRRGRRAAHVEVLALAGVQGRRSRAAHHPARGCRGAGLRAAPGRARRRHRAAGGRGRHRRAGRRAHRQPPTPRHASVRRRAVGRHRRDARRPVAAGLVAARGAGRARPAQLQPRRRRRRRRRHRRLRVRDRCRGAGTAGRRRRRAAREHRIDRRQRPCRRRRPRRPG